MVSRARLYDLVLVLVGVIALVMKGWFQNGLILSYGGNIAASFSTYFLLKLPNVPPRYQALTAVTLALLATELFEATDGFGVMSNTYDPVDYLANAAGVALAAGLDMARPYLSRPRGRAGGAA